MTIVALLDVKHVQRFTDRHGRVRHYFRRSGHKRVALKGEPGTVEFAESYQAALSADKPARTTPGEGPRSMGAAIAEYYLSADFAKNLKPSSQKGHRALLETFRREYGHLPVISFTAGRINQILHKWADRPAQASNLRKRLNSVFELVKGFEWIPANPIRDTKRVAYHAEGFAPWSEDDIAAYEAHWPTGSRERLALALLLYTGVRRSDAVLLGRQHAKAGRLSVKQVKTGVPIAIPIHPVLQAEIGAATGMTFLMTQYGKPFSAAGFTKWFVERARMAGVENRGPHGLRKAAGRRLAEAGCSAKEIAAVLGHSSVAMVEIYTRSADQAKLAESAFARVRENAS